MAKYPPPLNGTIDWNPANYTSFSSLNVGNKYMALSGGVVTGNLTVSSLLTTNTLNSAGLGKLNSIVSSTTIVSYGAGTLNSIISSTTVLSYGLATLNTLASSIGTVSSITTLNNLNSSNFINTGTINTMVKNIGLSNSTNPYVINSSQSFTNFYTDANGALTYIDLPAPTQGQLYNFFSNSSIGFRVNNTTGTTINIAGVRSSTTTGFITTTVDGGSITLQALNSSVWYANNYEGAFTVA